MLEHKLANKMREIIASGLKQKTLTRCSMWAENCVHMGTPFPGPFSFKHHPWTKEMHDSESEWNIGQKAAQMAYTVTVMNKTFFNIDVKRESCLYLLPTKTPDATDFSATRFDPALELSPYLSNLFSDVKNVATKRAGSATLYIRGMNSRTGLKSVPVPNIVFDEYDEMNQDNVPLALERTSGQLHRQIWAISTPTAPGHGINTLFLTSTMEHFFFKCPSCSRFIDIQYPRNLVITAEDPKSPDLKNSHYICHECKNVLHHEDKVNFLKNGIWQPTADLPDFNRRGFYINQMYSMAEAGQAHKMAEAFLRSRTDLAAEQEFFNSKQGEPHLTEGAQLVDDDLRQCVGKHSKTETPSRDRKLRTLGVDVGSWLHCIIYEWTPTAMGSDINVMSHCKLIYEGKVAQFEELDKLMKEYQIMQCVIDANPETRKAMEFAKRFSGHVKLCYYGKDRTAKSIEKLGDTSDYKITVDRTSWLDMTLSRFQNKSITIPRDASSEYWEHLKAPARIYVRDKEGNPVGKYINSAADHFAHASNYAEIALPLAASITTNRDIRSFL